MRATVAALADLDPGAAQRLAQETAAYRDDILAAVKRAWQESPVVRLGDGHAVPHVPTRVGIRGRAPGWIREVAYGPLHLVDCGVLDAAADAATWILRDLEDNLLLSREWGREVDKEQWWFSRGGATIQPSLLNIGPVYLRRGQRRHAVRALWNNLGQVLYRDVRCFAEHAVEGFGEGVGPFYKAPDECAFLLWLLEYMVRDTEDGLCLLDGCPLEWFQPGSTIEVTDIVTRWGRVSVRAAVDAQGDGAQVRCALPAAAGRASVRLVRPDGTPWPVYQVNGRAAEAGPDGVVRIDRTVARGHVRVEGRSV